MLEAIAPLWWPTARAEDSESTGAHRGHADTLTSAVDQWSTPRAISGGPESGERKQELGRTESGGGDLQAQAQMWQTPAVDSFRSRGGDRKDEMGLDQQARFWPSPNTRDSASAARGTTKTGIMHPGVTLTDAIRNWPTPAQRDHRDPNLLSYQDRSDSTKGEQLNNYVAHNWEPSRQVRPIRYGLTFSQRLRILRQLCRQLRSYLPSPYSKGGRFVNGKWQRAAMFKKKLNPIVRRLAPRVATWLVERRPNLQCIGNGVTSLCASVAYAVLAKRLGIEALLDAKQKT